MIKLTLLAISIFGGTLATLKAQHSLKRREREMKKSISKTFHELNKRAYLLDSLFGYPEFMKRLEESLDWLETAPLNPLEFLKFQTNFMEAMQGEHRQVILSCIALSQNHLHLSTKYFGDFSDRYN